MQKFEQECRLLSAIKHPHIVQYLGTYRDPESKLPVLLMELMDESLTRFLERSHLPLPYHTEVNLCHDIALALSYLHSNNIIHRNLSSNNVLLIAGSRAKVTDFGMAKLYDDNTTAHLTLCPGTMVYMSPEALGEPPMYTDKLDSFSLGVLGVQIMTRQVPDPGNRFKIIKINDPRIPSGTVQVNVPEIERRRSHINLIDPAHPLLQVALNCLKDRDEERPSCNEICSYMYTLKASPMYIDSVQSTNREKERQEHFMQQQQQQMLALQNLLTAADNQLQTLQQELTIKDEQLAGKDHQLQQKEADITAHQQEIQQLRRQQLQSSEQVTAEFQQNLLEREKTIRDQQSQIQELQQQLRQRGGQRQDEMEVSSTALRERSIKLRWRDGGRAPSKMVGELAAVDVSVAYFQPGGHKVFAYNSTTSRWSELPECPNYGFSLAVVNKLLTAIGGKTRNDEVTNSLLSLMDNKWIKRFPPMPTKRQLTAVVCSDRFLVVAGGEEGGEERGEGKLTTVEVMDTETHQWYIASSLPHPLVRATATLCGDQVYMLGGQVDDVEQSKSVFSCSVAALLQSCQPQSLGAQWTSSKPKVWCQLANTPVTSSTYISLLGQLLAVGGDNSNDKTTTAIHTYHPTTNSWEVIGHMNTPRSQCLVAVLPYNELMVVGGDVPGCWATDTVEFASIV